MSQAEERNLKRSKNTAVLYQAFEAVRTRLDSIGRAFDGVQFGIMKQQGTVDPLTRIEDRKIDASKLLIMLQILNHARNKFFTQLGNKTVKVPLVRVELHPGKDGTKIRPVEMVGIEILIHLLILVANAKDLARRVDRRLLIILTIMKDGFVDKHGISAGRPHLEIEARILIRGTGRRKEGHIVLDEELTLVDSRPDRRLAIKDLTLNLGVDVAGDARVDPHEAVVSYVRRRPEQEEVRLNHLGVNRLSSLIHKLEGIGFEEVIRLEDSHVLSLSYGEALVHGVAVTGIRLINNDEAIVARGILIDDFERGVGGAIVDADDLDIGKRLPLSAVQAFAQVTLDVTDWYKK